MNRAILAALDVNNVNESQLFMPKTATEAQAKVSLDSIEYRNLHKDVINIGREFNFFSQFIDSSALSVIVYALLRA
jgi:hypothetical protein